jgi:hypothetical protein
VVETLLGFIGLLEFVELLEFIESIGAAVLRFCGVAVKSSNGSTAARHNSRTLVNGLLEFIESVEFIEFTNLLISLSFLPRVTLSRYFPIYLFRFRIPHPVLLQGAKGSFN